MLLFLQLKKNQCGGQDFHLWDAPFPNLPHGSCGPINYEGTYLKILVRPCTADRSETQRECLQPLSSLF